MHLCLIPSHDESRGPSFNRRAERRGAFILPSRRGPAEFRCAAAATLLLGPGSAEPWALLASTSECCSWPRPCCALPPHVSAPLSPPGIPGAAPALPVSPASAGKAAAPSTCGGGWSRASEPAGDSRFHPRLAWLWVEKLPELEEYAENCSVICSLCSTGTWSWLELTLGSWRLILSNTSPVQAQLKRQMQNGLCTVGLAQLWPREARLETVLPTGTLGPVNPCPQGAQSRD